MSGSSPPAGDSEAEVTPSVTDLASDQAGRSSTRRHDRRAYVLVERPHFASPTPAQREPLIQFLADLLVAAVTRNRVISNDVPALAI